MNRLWIAMCVVAIAPAQAQSTQEQLTCGDSTQALATCRYAIRPTVADSLSAVVVQIVSKAQIRPLRGVNLQRWGPTGAISGPADSRGTTSYDDRSPGLYRVQLRGLPGQRGTWRYAATLRPAHRDTVVVDLKRHGRSYGGPDKVLLWST